MKELDLSEETRERIRLEELYRYELRKSLQANKQIRSRIFEILNKPFVLWILSSILLTGITTMYASHSASVKAKQEHFVAVQSIVADLSIRIERAKIQLKRFEEKRAVWSTIQGVSGAFEEFRDRDFLAVAVELQSLRPHDPVPKELVAVWQEIIMAEPNVEKAEKLFDKASSLLSREARLTR